MFGCALGAYGVSAADITTNRGPKEEKQRRIVGRKSVRVCWCECVARQPSKHMYASLQRVQRGRGARVEERKVECVRCEHE